MFHDIFKVQALSDYPRFRLVFSLEPHESAHPAAARRSGRYGLHVLARVWADRLFGTGRGAGLGAYFQK